MTTQERNIREKVKVFFASLEEHERQALEEIANDLKLKSGEEANVLIGQYMLEALEEIKQDKLP